MKICILIIIFLFNSMNIYSQNFNDGYLRIGINYGLNSLNNNSFDQGMNNSGSIGFNIGTKFEIYNKRNMYEFYLLSNFGYESISDLKYPKGNSNNWQYNASKLFMNINISMGYNFGNIRLFPFFSAPYSFSWLKYNIYDDGLTRPSPYTTATFDILNKYDGHFRYGRMREGGFIVGIGSLIDVKLSLDRSIYYTRHLVLQEQLSTMLENCVQFVFFSVNYILFMAKPEAIGIYNFITQNLVSFIFSQLKIKKQYWPFNSDTPLYFDSFRLEFGFNISIPESKHKKIIL
jgi:hypothetical protein